MRHGSLFSGIGGFDLAAQWMGWENVFQVEWDGFCQKVLAKNFPNVKRYEDIKEFDGTQWRERVDIISGGFPCQPFSHAGKRKGTSDDRYLWPEMLRIIRETKPSFVVGENVAGLVSMENGKTLDRILSDLANEGYTTEQFIIPACAIGAWHRRDRIWIIAHSSSYGITRQNGESDNVEGTREAINDKGIRGQLPTIQYEGLDDIPQYASDTTGNGLHTQEQGELRKNTNKAQTGKEDATQTCRHKLLDRRQDVSDFISQRGCSRNTRGEYAKDVRELRRSQTDGYWDFEPSVGRVASRLSTSLDETLNDYKNGNANDQETITEIDLFRGKILRDMWSEQCPITEASYRTEKGQSDDFMLSMSHGYSHEKWKLGQRIEEDDYLHDMWQTILRKPQKIQDLQSRMLKRIREIERNEKVASSRVDRLKGLGNAIVPQVAFEIFKAIEQYDTSL